LDAFRPAGPGAPGAGGGLTMAHNGNGKHNGRPAARSCLGCGAGLPPPFLDLGDTPLANSYQLPESSPAEERRFPLQVTFCPACYLVQLLNPVSPEEIFSEYLYFSSCSDSFLKHCSEMAECLISRFHLGPASKVVEIASNDGYLLQYFLQKDVPCLGVEPAANVAACAIEKGIPTLVRFFDAAAVSEVHERIGVPDLIIGNNVLAHVPDINGFLRAVRDCLSETGCAVFEFPYVRELLDSCEFDTIYHEHVFYFSLSAIQNLAERAGLTLFDVTCHPVHGGSLRVFLQRGDVHPVSERTAAMLREEERLGLTKEEIYRQFCARVVRVKQQLLTLLQHLKRQGATIAAYGAPAKGNTLLNYCHIGTDLIEFTVDRNTHKQGLLLPGSRVPVLGAEQLAARRPDFAVILPWNLADEIMAQQKSYIQMGGKFIVPVPRPRVVQPPAG